jgi:lipopolysaccharide transport system ATP-binding protein
LLGLDSGGFSGQEGVSPMSSDDTVAVRVVRLSKSFKTFRSPFEKVKHILFPTADDDRVENGSLASAFRALDDVSFEVARGKSFGIMGQNGSGKSTLLQIISGILAPSAGSVSVKGKIAALLELGSGFNPEFTGRENVYLNASVLGLSKSEIDDKFDAIASFAEIGKHIELPVKTYSSGMMLRLAFAVQVAIEPEILIIDEALAVGDAKFQLKCFRRLDDLKAKGTTILFVSHATELVKSFCDEVLVLQKGKPVFIGNARSAAIKYYETLFPDQRTLQGKEAKRFPGSVQSSNVSLMADALNVDLSASDIDTFGVGGSRLGSLRIEGVEYPNVLRGGKAIRFVASFSWDSNVIQELISKEGLKENITFSVAIANSKGVYLFGCNGFDSGVPINCITQDSATVSIGLKMPHLVQGDYFLTVAIALGEQVKHLQLKWYDCLVPLRCEEAGRTIYGLMGVEYSFDLLEEGAV